MRTARSFALLALVALPCLASYAETARIGDFAAIDHQGAFHRLSRYEDQRAVVIFVQGNGCPIARLAVPTLKAIQEKFDGQGVLFWMLNANVQDDADSIRQEATEYSIDFPILIDEAQLVAESLGVVRTCEVFVIDPKTRDVVYRGPIDDHLDYEVQKQAAKNHYLEDALIALLAGDAVTVDAPEVRGCLIAFPRRTADRNRRISYTNEIVPILRSRCVSCHRKGDIAPWAMTSHEMVQGWGPMMRETVMTKRMPPGQIDNEIGQWMDVHHLTVEEQATLLHWIDAGSPVDGDLDPLQQIAGRGSPVWRLGEPDLILEIPPQEVPATGIVDYRYVTIPFNLDEEKWVRAYEFYVDNPAAVHHITTSTIMLGKDEEGNPNADSRTGFAGYAPGKPRWVYHDDVGYKLTPGMALRASLHYTPNGKAVTDRSKVGFYFRDAAPAREIRRWAPYNKKFVIPPHTADHPVRAERTVKVDSHLYNFQPHMHFRGKRMLYTAVFPDGREQKLLNVPNYDFNWQMIYTPKEPIFLPEGTKIVCEGGFDNSKANPANPAPEKEVRWGPQSWDEMFIGHLQLAAVKSRSDG